VTTVGSPVTTRKLGGYEVLLQLKTGGMGEVLLARRTGAGGFEKLVAIKTIRGEFRDNEELRRMFLDEAQLLSRLSHPAIAQVHDFGDDGGELFLVMEYVEGVRFRRLSELAPSPVVAAAAMAAVCRGLHAAHELADLAGHALHVVHRDITPENLMMTFAGQVKVLDFGIALMRGRQAPMTELGTIKGKPPYLSPEQLKCEPLDRRTDVFSAGLVLHELLTGEPVFVGESVFAVARAIEHDPVRPPSEIVGALPAGLDEAVMRAVHRDRDQRYPHARAFAEDLLGVVAASGGPSLEDFAATALADEREQHRVWLRSVLAAETAIPTGRPSGIMTAAGEDVAALGPASTDAPAAAPLPSGQRTELSGVSPRGGGARVFIALALVLGVALAIGLFALPKGGCESGGIGADGGSADGGAVAVSAADAAPEATVMDAAAAAIAPVDAAPSRKQVHKRPPREPVDAGDTDPPPDDPPPAAAFGTITVAAEPYALVRIDGTEIGASPIIRRRIVAGTHEVVLASPDSGAIRLRRTVRIEPGEHERVILE